MSERRVVPFTFSRVISAHSSDVKSVSAISNGLLLSGSRDGTAKIFAERAGEYSEVLCMKQSAEVVVNAVAFHQLPTGWLAFVGRMDGSIAVFSSESVEPIRFLRQHTNNVCALHVDSTNDKLVSGSWDNNAIVWSISDTADPMVLIGHKMTVWATASIVDKPNYYLTGSADMTVKLWNGNTLVNSFTGHEDVVRCIAVLSSKVFVSASNDCTIRVWDLDATVCLRKYTSFACEYIFGMTVVGNGTERMLANCGESGFVELWAVDSEHQLFHIQFLRTPAQSVWSIVALSNGDLAAGGSDGNIYIFTANEGRKATCNELEAFDANVAKRVAEAAALLAAQQQEVVKIKVALGEGEPDMELRYRKGTDPAEAAETFIKENNMPASFIDEITEYIKANIPEARRAAAKQAARLQAAQHVIVDGQENGYPFRFWLKPDKPRDEAVCVKMYDVAKSANFSRTSWLKWDYVFDVTTEDGRVLKLPYNVGEDTNWAARRFVEKNNLPVQFIHKVSALLCMQLPQASVTPNNSIAFVDPYTGMGRYVPGMISATNDGLAAGLLTDKKRPRGEFVPLHEFFRFGFEKVSSKAVAKLKEMNELQVEHRLTGEQLIALEDILTNATYEVKEVHVSAIVTGLLWTHDTIVPIIDAFRLALLNRRFSEVYCTVKKEANEESPQSRGAQTLQKLNALLVGAVSDPVRVLVCRTIANAAVHKWGREMLMCHFDTIISSLISQLSCPKLAVRLAAVSALANWALLLLKRAESDAKATELELSSREGVTRALLQHLKETKDFGEYNESTKIRLLQTIVTLMWGDAAMIKVAKRCDVVAIVNRIKDAVVDESGKAIARDIIGMADAVH